MMCTRRHLRAISALRSSNNASCVITHNSQTTSTAPRSSPQMHRFSTPQRVRGAASAQGLDRSETQEALLPPTRRFLVPPAHADSDEVHRKCPGVQAGQIVHHPAPHGSTGTTQQRTSANRRTCPTPQLAAFWHAATSIARAAVSRPLPARFSFLPLDPAGAAS